MQRFERHGCRVVGISRDREAAQRAFVEKAGLPFPMLCDPEGSTVEAYGAKGLFGFPKRVSVLVDGEGIVRKVYERVSPSTHAAEVLDDLERLV